jgi:hypothetical protein
MNKKRFYKLALRVYAALSGTLFGGAFSFFVVIPLLQLLLSIITGGRDTGANWLILTIQIVTVMTTFCAITGGVYISERWCSDYLERKEKQDIEKFKVK